MKIKKVDIKTEAEKLVVNVGYYFTYKMFKQNIRRVG